MADFDFDNLVQAETLTTVARRAREINEHKSVKADDVADMLACGWEIERESLRTTRFRRTKAPQRLLEDRVWTMLYNMGFPMLSGRRDEAILARGDGKGPSISAFDDDVALFIECQSSAKPAPALNFFHDAERLASLRDTFSNGVNAISPSTTKRRIAPVYWTDNLVLSESDRERTQSLGVRFFTDQDLRYYEGLIKRLGNGARYQFLAEVFRNVAIPGLSLTVPAIRMRFGPKTSCYTFSIAPAKLLRIAYVSHRWRDMGAADPPGYQRFMSKARLDQIRRFIHQDNGYFPTNIVLNLQGSKVRFEKSATKEQVAGADSGDIGWLHLPTSYQSAWIIDGQHRLYSYAGLKESKSSLLTVVAFDNIAPGEQLNLFVEINSRQKKVPQNLLTALYGDLRWDSPNREDQASAIVSRLVLKLGDDPEASLFGRISDGEDEKDDLRCITLGSMAKALNHPDLFVREIKAGVVPGAFWTSSREQTLARAKNVVSFWFQAVADGNKTVWDRGKAPGGGLATNNSCTVIINVLRAAISHLASQGLKPTELSDADLLSSLAKFSGQLSAYFSNMTEQERADYRALQGGAGQTRATRDALIALTEAIDEFNPPGIRELIEARSQKTNEQAMALIATIENSLRSTILDELKSEFGGDEQGWWFTGVPMKVRVRVDKERNEEASRGSARSREDKLFLDDFRDIARSNWAIFGSILGFGDKKARREDQLSWLARLQQIKKVASNSATMDPVKVDDLEFVRTQQERLGESQAFAGTEV